MSYLDKMKVGETTYDIKDSDAARKAALATLKSELEDEIAEKANNADLARVAKSGNYNDLSGTPVLAPVATSGAYSDLEGTPELAAVATSGDYEDLDNTPTVGSGTLTVQKNGTTVGSFGANATEDKTINILVPTDANDVNALPNSTKYGAALELSVNSSTYVITATLKDQNGDALGNPQTIDLPLESVVVNGAYDSQTKKVVLTLQNGSTIEFSVADLVSGLQSEINAQNKLSADYVDDTNATHKFVSASEKSTWDGKQDALTFDSTPTQGSTNPVTSGGVYAVIGDVESLLTTLISGNGAAEEES